MNLIQLYAFREVMLTGSVSTAAKNLNRTQPAISASIASLETELGLKLFERRGGRLHPGPEAQYLMAEATEIITRVDNSKRTLKNLRDLRQGSIRVVSMPGPSVFLMPEIIRRFVSNRQEIEVSLVVRSSFQVFQLTSVQQFDLGVADIFSNDAEAPPLVHQECISFECLCALPAQSPLAGQSCITPADLEDLPIAALLEDHPTNKATRAVFEKAGRRFNQRYEMQYYIPMFTLIEHGLAYAIVDPMSAESYRIYRPANPAIVFKPFKPTVTGRIALITPAYRPPSVLAKEFINQVRAELIRIHTPSGAV